MVTKSKIPKMISGILAAILIAVVSYILLPLVWFWIGFEVFAALLVAVGCVGEWYLFHRPAGREKREKEQHRKFESRFILAVAAGVTMEFFALAHAIPAAIRLEKEAANARRDAGDAKVLVSKMGTTNAWLWRSNLTLSIELAKLTQDRTITDEQEKEIVGFLKNKPHQPVWVVCNSLSGENKRFVDRVREILDKSGCGVASKLVGMHRRPTTPVPNALSSHGPLFAYANGIIVCNSFDAGSSGTDIEVLIGRGCTSGRALTNALRLASNISSSSWLLNSLGTNKAFVFVSPKHGL